MRQALLNTLAVAVTLQLLSACNQHGNPPADGFDIVGSDQQAIEIADKVMTAMGGRPAWDETRFISWDFFGRRTLTWDKYKGRVRIESPRDSTIYLLDMSSMTGRVRIGNTELTGPDTLATLLERAMSLWINDSYWLVMPYKFKDTGVTLKYVGEDTLKNSSCHVLQMTFKGVGRTPDNKYRVYVDAADDLVKKWCYFANAAQDTANFTRPWDNYQLYGKILLSADRSDKGGPANVKVSGSLPDSLFTEF